MAKGRISCFKSLDQYYRVTGNPEHAKVGMRATVIRRIPLAYNVRFQWVNHYTHNQAVLELYIDRPGPPSGRLMAYMLEYANCRVNPRGTRNANEMPTNWFAARHFLLLKVFMQFSANKDGRLKESL